LQELGVNDEVKPVDNTVKQSMSIQKEKKSVNIPVQQRSVQEQFSKNRLKMPKPVSPVKLGGEDAIKTVEDLRKKLHKELLEVLEFEQKKEVEREETLKKVLFESY